MNTIIKNIEDAQLKAQAPEFRVGDTVRVSAKIKEGNRERIQVFEGTVLKKQGTGVRATFTVRKISNGVGVEKTWPLHSPIVEKVEVVRFADEPCIAIQFCCSISAQCILVDEKIVFAANIFQVALIALLLHEVALAERYVWHVAAITIGLLGTTQNIVSLADAVETAYALGFLIKGYISQ